MVIVIINIKLGDPWPGCMCGILEMDSGHFIRNSKEDSWPSYSSLLAS